MRYVTGNILESNCIALVNPVNVVGKMGKGLALEFKNKFPLNFKIYELACKAEELTIGKMLVVGDVLTEHIIINFPTKTHWKLPSKYEGIEAGLKDLVKVIE